MLYQVDGLSDPQKVFSVRAWVHANGSSNLASSGLSSLGSSGTGHYTLNYAYTYPDTYASVACIPNNNYDDALITTISFTMNKFQGHIKSGTHVILGKHIFSSIFIA